MTVSVREAPLTPEEQRAGQGQAPPWLRPAPRYLALGLLVGIGLVVALVEFAKAALLAGRPVTVVGPVTHASAGLEVAACLLVVGIACLCLSYRQRE